MSLSWNCSVQKSLVDITVFHGVNNASPTAKKAYHTNEFVSWGHSSELDPTVNAVSSVALASNLASEASSRRFTDRAMKFFF
jgi:hypothetical protein